VIAFAISPPLRAISDYPSFWKNGYFECDFSLSDVVLGFFCTGYFPMLPWILFPLAGYVAATYVFAEPAKSAPPAKRLALLGTGLMGAAAVVLLLHDFAPPVVREDTENWSMFPATVPYILGTLGVTILALSLARLLMDLNPRFPKDGRTALVIGTYSRYSLSIYVLHQIVHLWPLWIYAVRKGLEQTYYWRKAMPQSASISLAVLFIALCYVLFRWMDRAGGHGIESFMRWFSA
jgi:hypothetical protein